MNYKQGIVKHSSLKRRLFFSKRWDPTTSMSWPVMLEKDYRD